MTIATLPGRVPYVLRAGDGISHLVAGQVIRTLARTDETAGGFGAVVCDCPLDRGPIPMHWHEREHDTWFVTRGKLAVWKGGEARVLHPGDFAYVKPGDAHSYQSVAPRTQFFGIVAPGGWEAFFADAGEVWGMTTLPPADRPFDFSRMGPAMAKHGIMRVENPVYAEPTATGIDDQAVPVGQESYFLEAGFGQRHTLFGHLATAVLTRAQSNALLDMRVIEGSQGAVMPTLCHAATHVFLHILDGKLVVMLDGEKHHLCAGDSANVPAGTHYATCIETGSARWVLASSSGNGAELWSASEEAAAFSQPLETDAATDLARLRGMVGVDVSFV